MRFDQSQIFGTATLLPPAAYNADNTPVSVDLGAVQSPAILTGS